MATGVGEEVNEGGALRRRGPIRRDNLWFYGSMLSSIESTLGEAGLDVLVYQLEGQDGRRRFFEQLPAMFAAPAVQCEASRCA